MIRNVVVPDYSVGVLDQDEKVGEMKYFNYLSSAEVRDLINSLPGDITFVGNELRSSVLAPLMRDLARIRVELPEKLKFHWVPPFKLPFDDLGWIYNFGIFPESGIPLSEMALNLGIDEMNCDPQNPHLNLMAKIYFTLIGDFNKI
jgi:hypothetical protein